MALNTSTHAPAPKRKRAGTQRSRLGCLTCKKRQVKCDQRKPVCARCEKAQLECDGYVQPEPNRKVEPISPPFHPLKPRAGTAAARTPQRPISQLPRSFTGLPVIRGKNVHYFDIFRYHIVARSFPILLLGVVVHRSLRRPARWICPRINPSDWSFSKSHFLFQSISRKARRYCCCAASSVCNRSLVRTKITNHHHRASLLHHLRAVSGFRSSIRDGDATSRPGKVLIMTLLLIAYEILKAI